MSRTESPRATSSASGYARRLISPRLAGDEPLQIGLVRERQMESARAPTYLCGGEPLYGHSGRRHRKWRFAGA